MKQTRRCLIRKCGADMGGGHGYRHDMKDRAKQHAQTGATMARETRLILRLMEPVATLLMSNKCNKGITNASAPDNSEMGLKMK